MEEHEKLKEDADLKLMIIKMLFKLDIATSNNVFMASVEGIMLRHNMSGEEWDD